MEKFNIYWTEADGSTATAHNLNLSFVMKLTRGILLEGGEVTGIINSSKDD